MDQYRGEPLIVRDRAREEAALGTAVERLLALLSRRPEPRDVARVIREYGADVYRIRFELGRRASRRPPIGTDLADGVELEVALLLVAGHLAVRRLPPIRALLEQYGEHKGRIGFRAGQTGGRQVPPPIPAGALSGNHATPVHQVEDLGDAPKRVRG